jgi:hypothetical protein
MASLERYLYDMEAAFDEALTAEGLVVAAMTVAASATCGVTTPGPGLPLPLPVITAGGSWPPVGMCPLPAMTSTGAQALWRPARGSGALPCPEVTGQATFTLVMDLLLTPLFYRGETGAQGEDGLAGLALTAATGADATLALPLPAPYGLSGLDGRASLASSLPRTTATAWSCGIVAPISNAAPSEAVVNLLCQGSEAMALAAAGQAGGATLAALGADVLAGRLLSAVADNLAYVEDAGDDVWTCALGTYSRGTGDCEDGAILLHGLLLAAGIAPDRLITVFGRVGVTRQGHAWVTYRRVSDGNWVVLDWTAGTADVAVASLSAIDDVSYYALVDYALTAQDFFPVRQKAAVFFPKACAVGLTFPLPAVAAETALTGMAACSLIVGWLRASALGAAAGRGVLASPGAAARAGANRLTASLAGLAIQAHTAPTGTARLGSPSVTGRALGAWAQAWLAVRPVLDGRAKPTGQGQGTVVLTRARLSGTGLCGPCGTGRNACPCLAMAARAWPGRLGRSSAALGPLVLTGHAIPTDPGQGRVSLPALAAKLVADSEAMAQDAWHTTSPEVW